MSFKHWSVKHWIVSSLAAAAALTVAATAALAELATVTANQLNVRRGPGTNYGVTYVLQRGDRVEITRRQGDWAFIVGERGGEGWVTARFLAPEGGGAPPGAQATNQIFKGQGRIDNARYKGAGTAQMVIGARNRDGSISLDSGGFSIEYIGTVRSNFEGTVQLDINKFRSSEMGYRTVAASGTCNIQTAGGNAIRQSFCTVNGAGIDHGRSNFNGLTPAPR
jgi:hypothetical protein